MGLTTPGQARRARTLRTCTQGSFPVFLNKGAQEAWPELPVSGPRALGAAGRAAGRSPGMKLLSWTPDLCDFLVE